MLFKCQNEKVKLFVKRKATFISFFRMVCRPASNDCPRQCVRPWPPWWPRAPNDIAEAPRRVAPLHSPVTGALTWWRRRPPRCPRPSTRKRREKATNCLPPPSVQCHLRHWRNRVCQIQFLVIEESSRMDRSGKRPFTVLWLNLQIRTFVWMNNCNYECVQWDFVRFCRRAQKVHWTLCKLINVNIDLNITLFQLRGSSARGRVGGRGRFWHDVRRTQRSPKDRIQNGFHPTTRSRCQGAQKIYSQDRIQARCWSCCWRCRSNGSPAIGTAEWPASENPLEIRFPWILVSRSFETSLEVITF